ncbi:MAG TPA: class I SAM-dependent methyltransferase [Candidatus Sulfopaludibacter sp.]|nr:class I SAM-dependent methyltransferase [Candidatus Sulfopaludibacter sp.]
MDPALRRAWTGIVTAEDYESHMAAIGQARAGADLTRQVLESAGLPEGARVVIAGAGTGQMLDYLDSPLLRPYRLTFTDLNPAFLARLSERLARCGLHAEVLQDDTERTAIQPEPDLLLATLLLEHIDWRRGVEVFAGLRPRLCAVIIQENPPGMTSAVTPGRRVPPSIEEAMAAAHATLVPRGELEAAFAALGYECRASRAQEVADGKRLVAICFAGEP